jgi:hypothetical protein
MAYGATLRDFPLASVVDGLISYLQFVFANPDIVPDEYRWNEDDRRTRIRISGVFVVDDEKPFSAPFIVVERGGFGKDDRIIDNLKKSDPNTFENPESVSIWDGSINIIFGGRSSSEVSTLANFVMINIDCDRHGIIQTIRFIRNLRVVSIGPEMPTKKREEILRWSVNLSLFVSLQMGWKNNLIDPQKFEKFTLKHIAQKHTVDSEHGETTEGSDLLVDNTKTFGFETSDDPQLLEQEFNKGWYYIRFDTQLYKVVEIVDEHTLKLVTNSAADVEVPWEAPATAIDLTYQMLWNSIHVSIQLP